MPNFHFYIYLFSKAVDSKKINLKKLVELERKDRRSSSFKTYYIDAARFFMDPKRRIPGFNFRDYFLVYNYSMAPRTHFLKQFWKSRSVRSQHISYVHLNRTKYRKGGLEWQVKVDTVKSLKKLRPFKGRVWSGLKTNRNLDKKIMKNDILCFGAFLSTSSEEREANRYRQKAGSKYLFQIDSKTGRDIKALSKFQEEAEILFYPYKKFKLINIYESKANNPPEDFGDFGGFEDEEEEEAEIIKIIHLKEIKDYKGPCKSLTRGKRVNPKQYFGD